MSSEREAELLRIIAGLKTEAAFNFQQYQDLGAATHQADLLSEARFDRLCKDMDRMTEQRDALRAELAQAKPKRASTLPAPRHGPCNYPYWRIIEKPTETAAEFVARHMATPSVLISAGGEE